MPAEGSGLFCVIVPEVAGYTPRPSRERDDS